MSTNENRISPDDPRLTAFALGELEGVELAQMEAELRADPAAQAIVAQIRIAADQFQAVLAEETVEAAANAGGTAQPARREGRARSRRHMTWGISLGGLAAACLGVLLVRENFRRQVHEPESVVALSRPVAETAAKIPAPVAIADRIKTAGTRLSNNIGDIPSSVTVIDKQQLENKNAQNVNFITPPMPAAAKPAAPPPIHRFNQVQGLIAAANLGDRGSIASTVRKDAAADDDAWIRSQIESGVSFDKLTTSQEEFGQAGFGDAGIK